MTESNLPEIDRSDHPEERKRVEGRIQDIVLAFLLGALNLDGGKFHLTALVTYCQQALNYYVSPDSASRVMRLLRQKKQIDYRVLSRKESFYCIVWVGERKQVTIEDLLDPSFDLELDTL